jgi:protein gp37
MTQSSTIEWTECTWNPVTGCIKISPGCKNCYAERMAHRLKAMGNPRYTNEFEPTVHEDLLDAPLNWKKSKIIFVNSMSDLFQDTIPFPTIKKIFETMLKAKQHQFQILTKRSERLEKLSKKLPWPSNVWMGVSVENMDYTHRIDNLRNTGAATKFLSLEPLLGPLPQLNLKGIHWVIVGGESGPKSRSMKKEWVLDIRDQCVKQKVPFFFKQWGGTNKKKAGRLLEGKTWDEMPSSPYF